MEQAKHIFHKEREKAMERCRNAARGEEAIDGWRERESHRVSRLEEKIDVLQSALIELGYALAKCELPIAPRRHIEAFRKLMEK